MPLMDALRSGVDLINASNQGVSDAAKASIAFPMSKAALYKAQIQNQYLPEHLRLGNQYQGLVNQYYGPEHQAAIDYQNIINQYQPEKSRLGNQYQGLVNKWYGPEHESAIREKNFFIDNPLLKLPGTAGQIGAAMFLQGKGGGLGAPIQPQSNMTPIGDVVGNGGGLAATPSNMTPIGSPLPQQQAGQQQPPMVAPNTPINQPISPRSYGDMILGNLHNIANARNARANLDTQRANNYNWAQLPAEVKTNLVAQGIGMGVDPVKMKDYVNKGMSIQDIARKEGLDPNNIPQPIYFPTTATKTRVQQVQQVGAELDYMSSATTPIISRNADTFFGKSPKLIGDMLSSDPERQKQYGEYIGALAIQTELAHGRILLAGGKSGVQIVKDLREKSLKGIDGVSPVKMSGIAFTEAQNTIDRILQRGAKIRIMTGMSPFSGQDQEDEKDEKGIKGESTEELLKKYKGGS